MLTFRLPDITVAEESLSCMRHRHPHTSKYTIYVSHIFLGGGGLEAITQAERLFFMRSLTFIQQHLYTRYHLAFFHEGV